MVDIEGGSVVKICGLMSAESAHTAALAGADMLGFILAESRRRVTPQFMREVRRSIVQVTEAPPALVGVMVNPTADAVHSAAEIAEFDYVQLSGDESPDILDEIDVAVIKTIHVAAGMRFDEVQQIVEPWLEHRRPAVALLIDAKVEGVYGGSGMQSDWEVAAMIAERYPALLAGGLNPGNVYEGIQVVGPAGVDVSSGVEIAGVKDHALIEAFIAHARQAFRAREGGGALPVGG